MFSAQQIGARTLIAPWHLGFGDGLGLWLSSEHRFCFQDFRGWVRGYMVNGFLVSGRIVKPAA